MDHRDRAFACALAAVAGFVDAIGFLKTGGYFVSFMSGNSTRLAVDVARASGAALLGLSVIGAFVAGVTLGAVVGRLAGKPRRSSAILLFVALALAAAAILLSSGAPQLGVVVLAFAMGAENTVFAEDGEVRLGLTYMTGALVRIGKGLAVALFGGERLGWLPHLLLWLSLVAGAALGGLAFMRIDVSALWVAVAAMAILASVAGLRLGRGASAAPDERSAAR